jgi:hypothetical protein
MLIKIGYEISSELKGPTPMLATLYASLPAEGARTLYFSAPRQVWFPPALPSIASLISSQFDRSVKKQVGEYRFYRTEGR